MFKILACVLKGPNFQTIQNWSDPKLFGQDQNILNIGQIATFNNKTIIFGPVLGSKYLQFS